MSPKLQRNKNQSTESTERQEVAHNSFFFEEQTFETLFLIKTGSGRMTFAVDSIYNILCAIEKKK